MKSKINGIIVIIVISIFTITGCSEYNEEYTSDNSMQIEGQNGEEFEEYTLKDYLGQDYELLSTEEKIEAEQLFNIAEDEFIKEGYGSIKYYELMDELDIFLREAGLKVAYYTMSSFIEDKRDEFEVGDYEELLEIEYEIDDLYFEAEENDELEEMEYNEEYISLREESEIIFNEYGYNYEEVENQIINENIQLALYDIQNGEIVLSEDSIFNSEDISKDEMDTYEKAFDHIGKIIPDKCMMMIVRFEVNTDGYDGVLAHVIEDGDKNLWRLAIDIKDTVNEDGTFSEEGTETIIHEMGHLLTLNNEQLMLEENDRLDTYVLEEGQLKEPAYLNLFYQEFWKDIIDEHTSMTEEDPEEGSYTFYEKYNDRFVSDYAATNPAEDIAETFRVFITGDKPQGNTIADQKVNFFYGFDEMVGYRDEIWRNLVMIN
ncbi:hypothetical protein [Clostridium sp. DL1XJH146]